MAKITKTDSNKTFCNRTQVTLQKFLTQFSTKQGTCPQSNEYLPPPTQNQTVSSMSKNLTICTKAKTKVREHLDDEHMCGPEVASRDLILHGKNKPN